MEGPQQPSTPPASQPSLLAADHAAKGAPLAQPGAATESQAQASMSPVMAYAQAQLNEQVARLTRQGYVIVSQSATSVQLDRPKHFSVWWALFWLIVGAGIGLIIYMAWFVLVKRDHVAFLRITPDGRVMLSES